MKEIKAVVIPTSLKDNPYVVTIKDDYRSYYPVIGCRAFDVVELGVFQDKSVDCYVDDEGLLNESPVNEYWLRSHFLGKTLYPLYGVSVITLSSIETGDTIETDLELIKKVLASYGFQPSELSF